MKRLLITGASGFIGKHVVAQLKGFGFEVHAPSSTELDLLDTVQVRDYMSRIQPSHLLHLAWITTPGVFFESLENIRWVESTLALAQAFVEAGGKRFVAAGTCFETVLEESPTLYGMCKDVTRELLQVYFLKTDVEFAWGRVFFLYGPGEHPERLVSAVTRGLLAREKVACTKGMQIRDYIYIEDCASRFVQLLCSKEEGLFDVASGHSIRLSELMMMIGDAIGKPELIQLGFRPERTGEPAVLVPKVPIRLKPKVSLSEGIRKTIEYWRDL